MEEKIVLNIDNSDLEDIVKKNEELALDDKKAKRTWLVFLIIGIVALLGGVACLLFVFLKPPEIKTALAYPEIPSKVDVEETYSALTGEVLKDAGLKNAPLYCIQVPNGLDGGRPQAGLTEAGVMFEAIAEAGITRFAALFQRPTTAIIGPVRSLRIYFLNWDTPFDCTIVHAGGSQEAMAALRSGGYKEMDENYYYMYRGTAGSRLWNNLFTTSSDLEQFGSDSGYNTSNINGFSRLTPEQAEKARVDGIVEEKLNITKAAEKDTSKLVPEVSNITFRFGSTPSFNVNYIYDVTTNSYLRRYADGIKHEVYKCSDGDLGEVNPEDNCSMTQLAPKVVIAMIVQERLSSDGVHEDITSIGSGTAYVFQNGKVTVGTWNKGSIGEQIKFLDESGNEISLIPGQTIISAVPNYGGVEY
ncbi:DUF3048 domain-containing protein [Candidatus Saccharibacteria bacterium]|nr:DUF3048 domain-containing protein [Candidatus Saccharibacteria bacterium]